MHVYHTHTRVTALCPGLPRWAGTRKVKPIWILLKQETASGSGISWVICKSAPRSRQLTMPGPHHLFFLQAGCPSCCPTNGVSDWRHGVHQLKKLQFGRLRVLNISRMLAVYSAVLNILPSLLIAVLQEISDWSVIFVCFHFDQWRGASIVKKKSLVIFCADTPRVAR